MNEHPLRQLCALWLAKIDLACQHKAKVFGKDAEEAMRFFEGPHDFMYEEDYAQKSAGFLYKNADAGAALPLPSFCMTVNKVAELVQLFGPVLYHRNPNRIVSRRKTWVPPLELVVGPTPDLALLQANPALAMQFQQAMLMYQSMLQEAAQNTTIDDARAMLLEAYLNYTPNETNLSSAMRLAIDEALIKGRGVLWTELWQPPGSQMRLVGSFWETVDNLVIDPDMETIEDAEWIARKCCHPVWRIERDYGLPPGSLKGALESLSRQAAVDSNTHPGGTWSRKHGASNDLLIYWKVYSRMGLGARLTGAPANLRAALDQFGDHCFLVVAKDVPYPLNFPPQRLEQIATAGDEAAAQQLLGELNWPVPFHADAQWPFTELDFHKVPGKVWPMAHIKPGMGYQKFLNWAFSFLASKVRNTSRDFIAVLKSAGEEVKQAVLTGGDLTMIEIEAMHQSIDKVIQFLQHPGMNQDILRVVELVDANFERATGLTETMYGTTNTQPRSATETVAKREMTNIRPDDMAEKVEAFASMLARKEAIAARYLLEERDVLPVLKKFGTQFWMQHIKTADLETITREFDYRVEAGSSRKPNRERDTANTNEGVQVLLPLLAEWARSTGDIRPMNSFLQDWCKARELDGSGYVLQPPPPPTPAEVDGSAQKPPERNGKAPKRESAARPT